MNSVTNHGDYNDDCFEIIITGKKGKTSKRSRKTKFYQKNRKKNERLNLERKEGWKYIILYPEN